MAEELKESIYSESMGTPTTESSVNVVESNPVYKHNDGRVFTKLQLLDSGYTEDRIKNGLDNSVISLIGDTRDESQVFKSQDGRTFTKKNLVDAGYDMNRIEDAIANNKLSVVEKKNPLPSSLGATNGSKDGELKSQSIISTKETEAQSELPEPEPDPNITLVDWLESKKLPYDKDSRRKMAEQYGIQDYDFSEGKNKELLDYARTNYDLGANIKQLNYTDDELGLQKYAKDNNLPYDGSLKSKKDLLSNAKVKVKSLDDVRDLTNFALSFGNIDLKNTTPQDAKLKITEILNKEAQDSGITNFNLQDPNSVSQLAEKVRTKSNKVEGIFQSLQFLNPMKAPTGISEILETIGMPNDKKSRAKLALDNGIVKNESEYTGTGFQNDKLSNLYRQQYFKAKFLKSVQDEAKNAGIKNFNINNIDDLNKLSLKLKDKVANKQAVLIQRKRDVDDYNKNGVAIGLDFDTYQKYKLNSNKFGFSGVQKGYEFVPYEGGMVKKKLSANEEAKYGELPPMLPSIDKELERQNKNAEALGLPLKSYQGLQMMIIKGDYSIFEKDPEFENLAKTNPQEFKKEVRYLVYYPKSYIESRNKKMIEEQQMQEIDKWSKQRLNEELAAQKEKEKYSAWGGLKYLFNPDNFHEFPDRISNLGGYIWNNLWGGTTQTLAGLTGMAEDASIGLVNLFGADLFPSRKHYNYLKNDFKDYLTVGLGGTDKTFASDFAIGAAGAVANIIPSAAATVYGVPVGFIAQGYASGMDMVNSTPEGQKLPEYQKLIFAYSNGLMQGLIAKLGIDKIFGGAAGNKLALNTTLDVIKKAEANNIVLTPKVFEKVGTDILNSVKTKATSLLSHAGTGATFGLAMSANDRTLKGLLNASTGKNIFELSSLELPKRFSEIFDAKKYGEGWGEIAAEMSKGSMMSFISSSVPTLSNKTESALKSQIVKAETPEALNKIKQDINKNFEGKISQSQIENLNKIVDEYSTYNAKIPATIINTNQRVQIADNFKRRDGLVEELNNLIEQKKNQDPAFHEGIDIQIDGIQKLIEGINKDISDIYTGKKVEPTVITKEASDLVQSTDIPTEMNTQIQKVAEDNGIIVDETTTPQEVVSQLKDKIGTDTPIVRQNVDNVISDYEVKIADAERKLQENPNDAQAAQDLSQSKAELEQVKKDPVRFFEAQKDKVMDELQNRLEAGEDPNVVQADAISKNFDELIEDAKKYAKENPIGEDAVLVKGEEVTPKVEMETKKEEIITPKAEEVKVTEEAKPELPVAEITDTEYANFIDKGIVTQERLNDIAQKVKNKENLSDREIEIFTDKTSDINKIIAGEEVTPKAEVELPVAEEKITTQPIENPKVVITGTRFGLETLDKSNYNEKVDGEIKDSRGRASKFDENGILVEKDNKGNEIVHVKIDAIDRAGRPGYLQASVIIPEGIEVNSDALKKIVDKEISKIKNKNNYLLELTKVEASDFTSLKDAIIKGLKGEEVPQAELPKVEGKVEPKAFSTASINRAEAKKTYSHVSSMDMPTDARGAAMHWLSTGGKVSIESFADEVTGKTRSRGAAKITIPTEAKKSEFTDSKSKLTIDKAAHDIWESLPEEVRESTNVEEIRNELIDALSSYEKRVDIAKEFIKEYDAEEATRRFYEAEMEENKAAYEKERKQLQDWYDGVSGEETKVLENQEFLNQLIKEYENEYPELFKTDITKVAEGEKGRGIEEVVSGEAVGKEKEPTAKEVGKFEQKARKLAEKITKVELPDFLKTPDFLKDVKKSGLSAEDLQKKLADAVIQMGKLLDKGVEFSKALKEAVGELVGIRGEENRELVEKGFEQYYKQLTEAEVPELKKADFGEGEIGRENKKQFDNLTSTIPNAGEVTKYLSGETIKKYEGEELRNEQEVFVQQLREAAVRGNDIINKSRELFGDDYATKLLDYVETENLPPANKALIYVSLENDIARQKIENPSKALQLEKLQDLVRAKSQAFLRSSSLAINFGRLRKIAEVGYDISRLTNDFFSSKQMEQKKTIEKSIEATPDEINKQAEEIRIKIEQGIQEEVAKIYESLSKEKKTYADRALSALDKIQQQLRNKTYGDVTGITAFVDAGITTIKAAIKAGVKVADAIELGINKIKELHQSKTGRAWEKENEFRTDITEAFKSEGVTETKKQMTKSEFSRIEKEILELDRQIQQGQKDKFNQKETKESEALDNLKKQKEEKQAILEALDPTPKIFIENALIEQGYGRQINIKTKDGVEKRWVLDWKKLAGEEGSVDNIRQRVESALKDKGYTEEQILRMQDSFVEEYNNLRASIIEKSMSEIAAKNKQTITPEQKAAAKKLAEMYNYGLFDKDPVEYELAMAKTLGLSVASQEAIIQSMEMGQAMSNMFNVNYEGRPLTESQLRTAIQVIDEKMRGILYIESMKKGNFGFRASNLTKIYMDMNQRMLLVTMKQGAENPISGLFESFYSSIGYSGKIPKQLNAQQRKLARGIFKEIVLQKGIGYGNVGSAFVAKGNVDAYIEKMSDNQLIQAVISTAMGKTILDAVDSSFKAKITQQKFTYNLIKVLTKDRKIDGKIERGMSLEEAKNYVAEKISGQSFENAKETARNIIKKVNEGAGKKIFNDSELFVNRLATDIVNASLVNGEKITEDMVTAAYNAAYKAAGRGLGHVSNNFISEAVNTTSGKLESKINEAVKEGNYNKAIFLNFYSALYRNIINPFVGGGTNWVVLKAEKTGLGLLSGLGSLLTKKGKIDLTTETGLKQLENALYEEMKIRDKFIRGAVGGSVTALTFLLIYGTMSDDKYEKWLKENDWAKKYTNIITPEIALALTASKSEKGFKKYLEASFNKNEAFDKAAMAIKAATYLASGKKNEGYGKLGELVGGSLGTPVPWRLIRDGQNIYLGATGQEPYKVDYRPSQSFAQGFFKGGLIDYLGYAPKITEKTIEEKAKIQKANVDVEKIKNYKTGKEVTDDEVQSYVDKANGYIEKRIAKLKSEGAYVMKGLVLTKKEYSKLTKDEIDNEIKRIKSESSERAKKEIFGEMPKKEQIIKKVQGRILGAVRKVQSLKRK